MNRKHHVIFKRIGILAMVAVSVLFAGCSKDNKTGTAKVHVSVSDFAITQQDLPQTKTPQAVAGYSNAKAITLAFCASDGRPAAATKIRTTYVYS